MANASWPRWVFASVANHLHDAADTADVTFVVEHLDDRSETWKNAAVRAEATIAGPHIKQLSADVWRVVVDVLIIVATHRQTDTNAYNHLDAVGEFVYALDQCIEVKEYAPGNVVSPDSVGLLTPTRDRNKSITADHLKPGHADQIFTTMIQAQFTGQFSEG